MSEYTTIYLRRKGEPLPKYRIFSWEENRDKTEDELRAIQEEIIAYNESITDTLGCELFYLSTTASRQLDFLPGAEDPRILTAEMLDSILDFYSDEINEREQFIETGKKKLVILEDRIRAAKVELYDKINQEIFNTKTEIDDDKEILEGLRSLRGRFEFISEVIRRESNAEKYELIYTKS